jgi:hypothetical protein
LKEKSKKMKGNGDDFTNAPTHVNFFENVEKHKDSTAVLTDSNEEYMAEKKAENDRYTVYLGGSSLPKTDKTLAPWYSLPNFPSQVAQVHTPTKKEERKMEKEDPLLAMNRQIQQKKDGKKKNKDNNKSAPKSSLESLREQRLQREKEERDRVQKILFGDTAPKKGKEDAHRYHSSYTSYSGGVIRGICKEYLLIVLDSSTKFGKRK